MNNSTLMIIGGVVVFLIVAYLVYYFMYKRKPAPSGESGYKVLSSDISVSSSLNDGLLAILAPWCGYCKKLKASKILKTVSESISVVEIDDKHPDCADIMKKVKAPGYPTLIVVRNGNMELFQGSRTVEGILKEFN